MFRHLPPTATPLPLAALMHGITGTAGADRDLREAFCRYTNTHACFTAASGRTALYLLLRTLHADQPARRQVCLPAYTCPSLVRVIQEAGLTAVPIDLNPHTLEMRPDALRQALGSETLAVIHVHPFGIPQPIDRVQAEARAVGAQVIEDVAQSMGAAYGGRKAGSHGDFGLFSLGPGKPLSAGGGGIVTVNRRESIEKVARGWQQLPATRRYESLAALGRLALFSAAFEPHGWWLATKAGAQRAGDNEENWGFHLRGLTAAQAAVANAQLSSLDAYNAARKRNADALLNAIGDHRGLTIPLSRAPQADSVYLRLPLIFTTPAQCAAAHDALQAAGIGAGRMYKQPLTALFPAMKAAAPERGARQVAAGLLTLPTHHYLTPQDIARISGIVLRTMERSHAAPIIT